MSPTGHSDILWLFCAVSLVQLTLNILDPSLEFFHLCCLLLSPCAYPDAGLIFARWSSLKFRSSPCAHTHTSVHMCTHAQNREHACSENKYKQSLMERPGTGLSPLTVLTTACLPVTLLVLPPLQFSMSTPPQSTLISATTFVLFPGHPIVSSAYSYNPIKMPCNKFHAVL